MWMHPSQTWSWIQTNNGLHARSQLPNITITMMQNIQSSRTYIGISTNITRGAKYSTRSAKNSDFFIPLFNSYVENITRARCGHLEIPKHVENTQELVQTSARNLLKSRGKEAPRGAHWKHYEQAPLLGPITRLWHHSTGCSNVESMYGHNIIWLTLGSGATCVSWPLVSMPSFLVPFE